jgi:lipopolysaccharide export system permease protein
VFFIEKDANDKPVGNNVFIATKEQGKETITSARSGKVEVIGRDKFLVLESGQRLERTAGQSDVTIAVFEQYGVRVGGDDQSLRSYAPASSLSTLDLIKTPSPLHLSELSWRAGLTLAAINLVVIGLAAAGANPRAGRVSNLGFAFLAFVVYFNMLILGKSWINSASVRFDVLLLAVHGGALALAMLWLTKRHYNWSVPPLRKLLRARREGQHQ